MSENRFPYLPLVIGVLVVIIVAFAGWFFSRSTPSPASPGTVATSTEPTTGTSTSPVSGGTTAPAGTVSPSTPATPSAPATAFSIDSRDTITSWTVQGAFSTEPGRSQKLADIQKLTGELSQGTYAAYDIYIGIAQDYELMGDAKSAYQFYLLAAANQPGKGLAFNDIGSLMLKLGALHSAQIAFARAVKNEPRVQAYQLSYLDFFVDHDPQNAAAPAAFASARVALNNAPDVIIAEANWKEALGDKQGAIADWQAVRPYVGAAQQAAIDAEIAKLQSS